MSKMGFIHGLRVNKQDDLEELKGLDTRLDQSSKEIRNELEAKRGSIDSLTLFTRCLSDANQDVVRVILRSKKEISSIPELLDLLRHYSSCSHKTLEFLNVLKHWLHGKDGVSWRLRRIKTALQEFKADNSRTGNGRTLLQRAVAGFMEASKAAVVTRRLYDSLRAVVDEQKSLYERLQDKKKEVDRRKEKWINTARKVLTVILASVYLGMLVCSAVAAALSPAHAPTALAVTVAIAAMNPVAQAGPWLEGMWAKYQGRLNTRSKLDEALMVAEGEIRLEDLESIRALMQSLQNRMEIFSMTAADLVSLRGDPEVKGLMEEMAKKIDEFSKRVADLDKQSEKCYKNVIEARAKILNNK